MIGSRVFHGSFGDGVILEKEKGYIIVDFDGNTRKFVYPDAFGKYLTSTDQDLMVQVNSDLQAKQDSRPRTIQPPPPTPTESTESQKKKRQKKVDRSNVAFKCNFCDGGKTTTSIGFNGVCSDPILRYNIEEARHVWCSSPGSPCRSYFDGEISREELEEIMRSGGDQDYVCYESQMLRSWRAFAGIIQNGKNKGRPMRLKKVQRKSLAVLTSREPNHMTEESRFIFAVFLVDDSYEGDSQEEGYVTTKSDWKISLTPQEARKILFWKYYTNQNKPETVAFNSGLHRYLSDEQAAQILRDIAEVRTDPQEKDFARQFFEHFCRINGINSEQVPPPAGALCKNNS